MKTIVVVMHPSSSGDLDLCTCMFFGIRMDYSFLLLHKKNEKEELEEEEEEGSDGCSEVQAIS
jgi:hypothetical protein